MDDKFMTALVGILGSLGGVFAGGVITRWNEESKRHHAFIEKQLQEFYSPMLGLRLKISGQQSTMRKVAAAENAAWQDSCEAREGRPEALQRLSDERNAQLTNSIDYDNEKWRKELLPLYHQMAELLREKLWLADPEIRAYYPRMCELVEIWDRVGKNAILPEAVKHLPHSEKDLVEFYDSIERRHDALRNMLANGK